MTNFEPKKMPPLGPPGRKLPTPPAAGNTPKIPQAPNLPPKIGGSRPAMPAPKTPSAPVPPQKPQPQAPTAFPPAYNNQPAYNQPQQQQPAPQQPQQPQPQSTWEENYASYNNQPQQPYQDETNNNVGYPEETNTGWGRQTPRRSQRPEPEDYDEDEEDEEVEAPKKSRKAANKKAATKKKSNKKTAKEKKPNPYSGSRKKLLLTRIALFGTIGVLVAAGVYSFVPKASYLTAADQNTIITKVRENLGETYFPTEAGEGWSRGFLDVYLNYTPETAEERKKQLLTYTTEEVLKDIDITFLTPEELDRLSDKEEATVEDLAEATGITDTKVQVVTAGPYLIKQELLPGDSIGIFSYKVQINGNNWAYIEVPIFYNMEQRGLSVSGTPTFRSVIPISKPPESNREVRFDNDREVSDRIKNDITAYMKAWVSSDQTGIDRYLVKEGGTNAVTPQASTGLGGSVEFLSLDKMTVQIKTLPPEDELTAEAKADFNERYVVVSIRVIEPTSGIVYRQNYQLVIQYVNENWFIQDIRSMVVFADN